MALGRGGPQEDAGWDASHACQRELPSTCLPRECWATHLAAVPGLSLRPAATGSVVILSLDLSHNAVHVQVPAVVHLDDDRGV